MSERSLPLEVLAIGETIQAAINEFEARHPGVTIGRIDLQHSDANNAIDDYQTKACTGVLCHAAIVAFPPGMQMPQGGAQ